MADHTLLYDVITVVTTEPEVILVSSDTAGPQGPQGVQGVIGPQGVQGIPGPVGPAGDGGSITRIYRAGEPLAVNDLVYVFGSTGNMQAMLADNMSFITLAVGYAATAANTGDYVDIKFAGTITGTFIPGGNLFLSDTSGQITQVAPSTPGCYVQRVGTAISTTEAIFDKSPPVRLANV